MTLLDRIAPLVVLAVALFAGCVDGPESAPRTPSEAIALARQSGPELTAASLALDAGTVLTATAASARCADAACRARAARDAADVYLSSAEALRWAVAAHNALAPAGASAAVAPDVEQTLVALGFVRSPLPDDPDRWCAGGPGEWGSCVDGPPPGGPAPAPGPSPRPPPPPPQPLL